MKTLILFVHLILISTGFSQSEKCNAVIFWKYEGQIKLFNQPNGEVSTYLQNDLKTENYLSLTIKDYKEGYFLVDVKLEMDKKSHQGWIKKNNYIGAFMKNESEYMDIKVYPKPNILNTEPIIIKNWKTGFVTIEECNDEWTKITIEHNSERVSGWIESIKLCANNYTSCS